MQAQSRLLPPGAGSVCKNKVLHAVSTRVDVNHEQAHKGQHRGVHHIGALCAVHQVLTHPRGRSMKSLAGAPVGQHVWADGLGPCDSCLGSHSLQVEQLGDTRLDLSLPLGQQIVSFYHINVPSRTKQTCITISPKISRTDNRMQSTITVAPSLAVAHVQIQRHNNNWLTALQPMTFEEGRRTAH